MDKGARADQPTVDAVVEFLTGIEGLVARAVVPERVREQRLSGIAVDTEAVQGDAAWISGRVFALMPERLQTFAGTLLLTPMLPSALDTAHAIVECTNPKLAFTFLIDHFFQERVAVRWPDEGFQISNEAAVDPTAQIGPGARIGSGTTIGANVVVGPNTVIANTTIEEGVVIGANCTIGLPGFGYERNAEGRYLRFPHVGGVLIKTGAEIGSNTCIDRGTLGATIIGAHVKIDNLVHIAHNVSIGDNSLIIAHAMLGGSVEIGDGVWCAPSVAVKNKLKIGAGAVLGMGTVVLKDVSNGATIIGNPGRELLKNRTGE